MLNVKNIFPKFALIFGICGLFFAFNVQAETIAPDLTVTDISFSKSVQGEEGTLSVTIKNLGGDLTSGAGLENWYNNFSAQNFVYSAKTPSANSHQSNRENPTVSNPLKNGESVTFSWIGNFNTSGNLYLYFKTDYSNELVESNENNNSYSDVIVIGSRNTSAVISSVNIKNITGNSATIEWISNNSDISHLLYGTENSSNGINNVAKNGLTTKNHSLLLSNLSPNKKYYFIIQSDSLSSNTVESEVFSFTTSNSNSADLTVSGIKFTADNCQSGVNAEPGQQGTLSVTVKNLGGDLTDSSGLLSWYNNFSTQGFVFMEPTAGILNFQTNRALPTTANSLKTNESIIFTWIGKINTAGNRNLQFTVDNANELAESNENNNTLSQSIVIGSCDTSATISNVNIKNITGNSATIEWISNNSDISNLLYGTENSANGINRVAKNNSTTKNHSLLLSNLSPNKKYYFIIQSDSLSSNAIESEVFSFTTNKENAAINKTSNSVVPATKSSNTVDNNSEDNSIMLKLQRTITALETKVIELEKKLTNLDNKFAEKYSGTMFLDVENQGRLWYVDPASKNRFYFSDGDTALSISSELATGITYENLQKIPVGVPDALYSLTDSDSDGLSDKLESALGLNINNADTDSDGNNDKTELENGYNPVNNQKYVYDEKLVNRLEGKMLLQVSGANSHGEIWYVYKGKRWYGGTKDSMYEIMKSLSLGATAENIRKITVGEIAE